MKDASIVELNKKVDKMIVALASLQELVLHNFKEINGRLDKLEQRMDRLEERIDRLEERMDQIEQKMEERHQDYMTKFDSIFGQLATLNDENTIGTYQTQQLREEVAIIKKRLHL